MLARLSWLPQVLISEDTSVARLWTRNFLAVGVVLTLHYPIEVKDTLPKGHQPAGGRERGTEPREERWWGVKIQQNILLNSSLWVLHRPSYLFKSLLTHFGNLTTLLPYLKSSKGFSCFGDQICCFSSPLNLTHKAHPDSAQPPFPALSPLPHSRCCYKLPIH